MYFFFKILLYNCNKKVDKFILKKVIESVKKKYLIF